MRTRPEIESSRRADDLDQREDMLEVLLDIRELLQALVENSRPKPLGIDPVSIRLGPCTAGDCGSRRCPTCLGMDRADFE